EERDPLDFSAELPLIHALKTAGPRLLQREVRSIGWYSSGEIYHAFKAGHIDQGCMFGPGLPWLAHHTDEQLPIADLVHGARMYAAAALALCGDYAALA
ncbi:MAG TPA: hypothetical protein VJN62_01975, partial [Gemmatimonadales bacterium]|nr:hypothetical protein [Gemmatimonadales bacterium]